MMQQSYYCNKCEKFISAFTTHLNPEYSGTFLGYPVKQSDSYCPYCGHKSTHGEMPPIEYVKKYYGINEDDESEYDEFEDDESEDDESEEYDEHDWCLPEDDKTVRMFHCGACGENFKIGYCDGRRRKVYCPLCGGNARRME